LSSQPRNQSLSKTEGITAILQRTDPGRRPESGPPPILVTARDLTLPPLRQAIDGLHPDLARLCGYHFGWCAIDGSVTGSKKGKFLRAGLVMLCAEAVGAAPASVLPGAVAVELVHNFSLLHDDIMDHDDHRRGRPAAWVAFGLSNAILAGDALIGLAMDQLTRLDDATGRRSTGLLADAINEMIRGQAADLALDSKPADEVTAEHYMAATYKTTALLYCCAAIGVTLGGGSAETATALGEACRKLGLAWQMENDVENIWGDPDVTGKPTQGDLRQAKKTLPVIAALRSQTAAGFALAETFSQAAPTDADLYTRAMLIERAGGREHVERLSRRYLDQALAELATALEASAVLIDLTDLFRFIVPSVAPAVTTS
jgi:geranylgeranyl diphosphate synthase, type I